MKRFHSPLQKIHAVSQQQRRLAELELARRLVAYEAARAAATRLSEERDAAIDELGRFRSGPRQQALLLGLLARVELLEEQLQAARRRVVEAGQARDAARAACADRNSREERLARLIERQRAIHRKEAFKEQQALIDDVSAGRWTRSTAARVEEVRHG